MLRIFEIWRAFVWWLKGPHNQKAGLACMTVLALVLCLTACEEKKETSAPMQIAVVDVERVLKDSVAAIEGRQHLAAAQKRLREGWGNLQKTWAKAPQKERDKVLAEGQKALNKQMANEETAANQLVLKLMRESVRQWRATNNAVAVVAKQNLLDVAEGNDITAEIITLMDRNKVEFPALPMVKVHEPKGEETRTSAPAASATAPAKPIAPAKQDPRNVKQQNKR